MNDMCIIELLCMVLRTIETKRSRVLLFGRGSVVVTTESHGSHGCPRTGNNHMPRAKSPIKAVPPDPFPAKTMQNPPWNPCRQLSSSNQHAPWQPSIDLKLKPVPETHLTSTEVLRPIIFRALSSLLRGKSQDGHQMLPCLRPLGPRWWPRIPDGVRVQ